MSSGGAPSGAQSASLSPRDLLLACAQDSALFGRTWFPKTMRQKAAPAHERIFALLEDSSVRFANIEAARDFAKTSIARIYSAKRIAYATSHVMMYIGASDADAVRSLAWMKRAIAKLNPSTGVWEQTKFAQFYGLRKGSKWNETEFEVFHGIDQRPIYVLGLGFTGSVRGVNFDDYRPDFIYCDDILTDENTATKEQRAKVQDLVFGAIKQSLAPRVDEPNSKMVLSNTPHDSEDVCAIAKRSVEFTSVSIPCWTEETLHLPVEQQISAWPERHPTEDLRKEKLAAVSENRYSVFAREKECLLITSETASFKSEWLQRRTTSESEPMYCVLAIDPVPPPSERQLRKALSGKDFECQIVVGRKRGEYHVLAYELNRGHEPNWSVATALSLGLKWRVSKVVVETVAYQKVLQYLLELEMKRRGIYFVVKPYRDKRSKYTRITGTLAGPLSQRKLFIAPSGMEELVRQVTMYPNVQYDDAIDALSMAMSELVSPFFEDESASELFDEAEGGIWDDAEERSRGIARMCP